MAAKKRIGILGGGGILGAHAPALLKANDKLEVTIVAERDESRHARIRELLGKDVEIVGDYHDVLKRDDVDAVDILLPHFLHMPATVDAAKAGKHVLIEKVMARNTWECDRMIEACDNAGVTLTICHDRRYHGEWEALKNVIDTGVLGDIFFWKLDHNQDVLFPEGTWVRTRDGIGGGAIMSCLTHQIDGLRWYGGEIDRVTCMTRVMPERMEGESLGVMVAQMASGALAELSINWRTKSHHGENCLWYEMVQVCGTKGEAYRMSGRGTYLRLHEADDAAIEKWGKEALEGFVPVPCPEYGGHEGCVREWAKLLHGEPADIRTSGVECRGTVEVAEAAYASVDSGRTISMPVTPVPWEEHGAPEAVGASSAASYHIEK